MRTSITVGEGGVPPELKALDKDYVFIRELGRGGTATVLLARHRASGQLVAVKMMHGPHVADEDASRRFAREAAVVEHLDHPNIVRTHTVERLESRTVAIVMEHVVGVTLRQALRDGPFDFERATRVLRDVAEALLYAHAQGLVHRDVKPENIFLEQGTGRALLSDFGTARSVQVDASLTLAGSAIGTPAYMSPEQIDGGALDGRSDLYSLGLVGWEMIVGRRAYDDESVYGILYKQKHEPLQSLAELRPDIPARLLFALEGALRKDRAERWPNMEAFLAQLLRDRATRRPTAQTKREPTAPRAETSAPTVRLERPRAHVAPRESRPLAIPLDQWEDVPPGGWDEVEAPDPFRRRVPAGVIVLIALVVAVVAAFTNVDQLRRIVAGASRSEPARKASGGALATAQETSASSGTSLDTSELSPDTALASALEAAAKARDTLPLTLPQIDTAPAESVPPTPPRAYRAERVLPPPRTRMDSLRRCNSPASVDQRACLGAWVAEGDVELNRVYRQLVGQLYREPGDNTASVRTLSTQQRGWLAYRDADCARRYPARAGSLWAPKRAECMRRMGDARVAELTRQATASRTQDR